MQPSCVILFPRREMRKKANYYFPFQNSFASFSILSNLV